jgi:predicted RNA-binding Zn-ribbon protein involved in translation (DUF1610 family)
MSAALRVADVIRSCWETYNRVHRLPPHVGRAVRHILRCRTAAQSGHMHACDQCGSEVPMYNSCQDRHCPTCQTSAKEKWLGKRRKELLPVQYFHCVFTLPHLLNGLIDANRKRLLGELFGTVNWVLQAFAHDHQWRLEGELGVLAVLHTWTQKLQEHFHLHCIVPGGVWREATGEWIHCRARWLFKKDTLATAFRNRYIKRLCALRQRGKLSFHGAAASLADETNWNALIDQLQNLKWVVYPKPAPAGAENALDYLGRYTHKVAIADYRVKALENGRVTYSWRDREDNNVEKLDTLPVEEFTKRFCTHILPKGFMKIRYYGWLSSGKRKTALPAIRKALDVPPPDPAPDLSLADTIFARTGVDISLCPHCRKGHLRNTGIRILPQRGPP